MICIFCGKDIPDKQYPVPVAQIHFQPVLSGNRGSGDNILNAKYSCQQCHRAILTNAAKASEEDGKVMIEEGRNVK